MPGRVALGRGRLSENDSGSRSRSATRTYCRLDRAEAARTLSHRPESAGGRAVQTKPTSRSRPTDRTYSKSHRSTVPESPTPEFP